MLDDVRQTADVEGDHGRAAGLGLDGGVEQIILPRWHHQRVGGAIERAQAEVVAQLAGVVNRKTQIGCCAAHKSKSLFTINQ